MIKFGISILLIIMGITCLNAQDFHFSQYDQSYLNLNPALTGQFNGNYRINANFKNQWASVSEPYQTLSFAADAKNIFKNYKALSLGIQFLNDEAGLGGLQTNQAGLSVSHDYPLNADSSFRVIAGVQLGFVNRSINFKDFTFDNQYNGSQYDANRPTGENFDRSSYTNFNLNSGIAFNYQVENRKSLQLGMAFFNLTSANQSFYSETIPIHKRITVHAQADWFINRKIDLLPSLLFSKQSTFKEIVFGSNLRYRMNESQSMKRNIYGGIWYRNQDALILSTGLDYNQWLVGISYDINLSDLDQASNKKGGLEIAITYIIKTYKPQILRHKLCPKFM